MLSLPRLNLIKLSLQKGRTVDPLPHRYGLRARQFRRRLLLQGKRRRAAPLTSSVGLSRPPRSSPTRGRGRTLTAGNHLPSPNAFSAPHAPACCTSPASAAPPRGQRPPPHTCTQRHPRGWPRLHTGPSPCRRHHAREAAAGSHPHPPGRRQAAAAACAGCGNAARRGSARGHTRPGGGREQWRSQFTDPGRGRAR